MKTFLHHLQINIDPKNIQFYKDLMTVCGATLLMEETTFAGYQLEGKTSVWFMPAQKEANGDYDLHGVNHIGLGVDSIAEVDEVVDWLAKNNIAPLFDTPQHRVDFAPDTESTYYQVMFESPDKVLFEVVFTGKLDN